VAQGVDPDFKPKYWGEKKWEDIIFQQKKEKLFSDINLIHTVPPCFQKRKWVKGGEKKNTTSHSHWIQIFIEYNELSIIFLVSIISGVLSSLQT
jgi:hypothetical protein